MEKVNRRNFLRYTIEAAIVAGCVGILHSASAGRTYVRPPGSLSEKTFTSRCMRCSICVEVCPSTAVRLIDLTLDFKNISTPVIDPRFGGCIHWKEECLKCVRACPTGALDMAQALKNQKLGKVWLKPGACVNCMVCFDRCPVQGALLFPNPDGKPFEKKIDIPVGNRTVNALDKPYINPGKCMGCGLCVHYCPEKIMYLEPEGGV